MADTRLTHASVNDGCDTPSPRHFSCCSQSRHFSMPCFARCMQATDGLSSACANLQRLRCVLEDGRVQLGHILRDLDPVIVVFGRCHVVMQYECTENARACTSMHEHVQCEQGCALRRWHTTHTHTHTIKHKNTQVFRFSVREPAWSPTAGRMRELRGSPLRPATRMLLTRCDSARTACRSCPMTSVRWALEGHLLLLRWWGSSR